MVGKQCESRHKPRLRAIAKRIDAPRRKAKTDVREVLFNKPYDLEAEVLKFEHARISEALAKVNGKVTYAAKLLGLPYQKLAYIIETKHPDLLKKRTPVWRRPRRQ
jgi:transcriptional regulator with GAF, ATPase, and Fis domain